MGICSDISVGGRGVERGWRRFGQEVSFSFVFLFLFVLDGMNVYSWIFSVMGYSADGFPFVGSVPEKAGQFICAGFSGHGMPQIFLSAKALASMVLDGKRVEEVDLPRLYRVDKERLQRTRNVMLEGWNGIHSQEQQEEEGKRERERAKL